MCTVRCGRHRPMLTSGAEEMSLAWSSSTTIVSRPPSSSASAAARSLDSATPAGLCATRLKHERRRDGRRVVERRPQLVEPRAVGVDVDADHVAAELFEQVEQRRERRVLDDDPVAEAQHDLGDAVEGVHRAVDDRDRLRPERPRRVAAPRRASGSTGWSR